MGREIKRVPLDFDWPMNQIWPPYMASLCTEQVAYAIHVDEDTAGDIDENPICQACKHAARLAGVPTQYNCPDWKIHPPAGDGYQLWETVTEGSPVSPVFATPEELAGWLLAPGNDTSITKGTTREQWLAMIRGRGWAPSMVAGDSKGLRAGTKL